MFSATANPLSANGFRRWGKVYKHYVFPPKTLSAEISDCFPYIFYIVYLSLGRGPHTEAEGGVRALPRVRGSPGTKTCTVICAGIVYEVIIKF